MKSKVGEEINFKERLKFEISGFSSFKTQSLWHQEVDSWQSWSTLFRRSSSSEKEIELLMSVCRMTIFGEKQLSLKRQSENFVVFRNKWEFFRPALAKTDSTCSCCSAEPTRKHNSCMFNWEVDWCNQSKSFLTKDESNNSVEIWNTSPDITLVFQKKRCKRRK